MANMGGITSNHFLLEKNLTFIVIFVTIVT